LEGQFEFWFGQIDLSGQGAGIVPAFVMDVPMSLVAPARVMRMLDALGPLGRPFLTQRTLFVGNVAGEGGCVGLLQPARLGELAPALEAAAWKLRKTVGAVMVVWKDFPVEQARSLAPTLSNAGYFRLPSYPATVIDVPPSSSARPSGGGLAGYFAQLRGDRRYRLKRKLRNSPDLPALRTEILRPPQPPPNSADRADIWRLFWATYEHGTTKFERFNPAVFDRFAEHQDSHWVILRRQDDGTMVAFMLLTAEGDHWVNRFVGFDYSQPKELFLYFRLFAAAMEYCSESVPHRPYLLSGQTGYKPKLDLGHRLVPLDNFSRHRNPLLHRVYARIARDITWSSLDPQLAEYLAAHPEDDISRKHW
jgi:hypothetical protein